MLSIRSLHCLVLIISICLLSAGATPTQASTPCTPRSVTHSVSRDIGGQIGNGNSTIPALSGDGRYVVFQSVATNLVPIDTNNTSDIFVFDRQTCQITRISISNDGNEANDASGNPDISADGRYIVFDSLATNLVNGDTNGKSDVFLYDRENAQITLVSRGSAGQGNDRSINPALSADGHFVVFQSIASNLVNGDSSTEDIYRYNVQDRTILRLSINTNGDAGNGASIKAAISSDGRYVAFESLATNLVTGDTNSHSDIFVRDTQGGTSRVSVSSSGMQSNGISHGAALSGDGRYVAFNSEATNLVAGANNGASNIYLFDRQTSITTWLSTANGGGQPNGDSFYAAISSDGRYVAFQSSASNLVLGDSNFKADVFVYDRQGSTMARISIAGNGSESNGASAAPAISSDGRYIAFNSGATNLSANDSNGAQDVFVTSLTRPIDYLTLFNPAINQINMLTTLQDNPPPAAYTLASGYAPVTGGQWVMGDWNGDGLKTPGVYANGPFYYTNKSGESQPSDWRSLWIGIAGPPVVGRFSEGDYDCIGAVQSASMGGQAVFVLYYTCILTGNPAPAISSQWLSAVLPDSGGFSGAYQFGAGDFDGGGLDSIAVRRGPYIAFTNVSPISGPAAFDLSQYIGAPSTTDAGLFVVGDWNGDGVDSFGLFYQNGEFFYRNDLQFNSGVYVNQSVGTPFAGTVQVATWH